MDPACPLGPSLSMEEKMRCPVDPPCPWGRRRDAPWTPTYPVGGRKTATLAWPRALLPAHMCAL